MGPRGPLYVTGVSVDSRRAQPGDAFVAIKGEVADGHDFLADAFARGAVMALVSRPVNDAPGPVVEVPDGVAALRALGTWVRDAVDPVVVGITGSTGKTSTKDLVASVAGEAFSTVAAQGSYNNELGVPLTLLSVAEDTEVLVCELGARGLGHIRSLCEFVRPRIGVVTNVGVTHYEMFGSVEAIAEAKAELPACLPDGAGGGVAVLNADDGAVAAMASATRAEVMTYGLAPGAAVRGSDLVLDRMGRPSFTLHHDGEQARVHLGAAGRHQVHNALAAAGVGLALGLGLEPIRAGLEVARTSRWRMEVSERDGVVLVNDTYNANPTSLAAALDTCAAMVPPRGRLLAVLGPMAELGALEVPEHEKAGRLAAACVARLVVVGDAARPLADAARAAGLDEVEHLPDAADPEQVVASLGMTRPGDVVLVKASRVGALERVARLLGGGAG